MLQAWHYMPIIEGGQLMDKELFIKSMLKEWLKFHDYELIEIVSIKTVRKNLYHISTKEKYNGVDMTGDYEAFCDCYEFRLEAI